MVRNNFTYNPEGDAIGIDELLIKQMLKEHRNTHKQNKFYVIEIKEENNSSLSRNYLRTIINQYAKETGESSQNLEKRLRKKLDVYINDGVNDIYSKDKFYDDYCVDKDTGDIYEPELKSQSKFSQEAMNLFIQFVIDTIFEEMPEFVVPDGSLWQKKRVGNKIEILFPEKIIKL